MRSLLACLAVALLFLLVMALALYAPIAPLGEPASRPGPAAAPPRPAQVLLHTGGTPPPRQPTGPDPEAVRRALGAVAHDPAAPYRPGAGGGVPGRGPLDGGPGPGAGPPRSRPVRIRLARKVERHWIAAGDCPRQRRGTRLRAHAARGRYLLRSGRRAHQRQLDEGLLALLRQRPCTALDLVRLLPQIDPYHVGLSLCRLRARDLVAWVPTYRDGGTLFRALPPRRRPR